MEIITVNQDNLWDDHICCALANEKDKQVVSKKQWLENQFKLGLVFKKMNVRGKCFIEYGPLDTSAINLEGDNLCFINCFWVSGKYQGQGNAKILLEECKKDCLEKGYDGLVIIATKKKQPFVMDYNFLVHYDFVSVGCIDGYEIMFLKLNDQAALPAIKFKQMSSRDDGFVLYYSNQCPFTAKYVPLLETYCQENNIKFQAILLNDYKEAKKVNTLFSTYSLFYNHHFITREILTVKKFIKIMEKLNAKDRL